VKLRAGIIGCGKVADKHTSQILRIKDAEIVGVCDSEELMAQQLAERYGIRHIFTDVGEMLSTCQLDVVHITTPPQSHYSLARKCLESGCHVFVEKPLTLNSQEAESLLRLAESKGQKLTVGHETQFMPVAMDMRRLIQAGYLGGAPVHMESVYCYDFSDERYARALLGDKDHWIRRLPGGLLQNIISHGIGKIVEYLTDDDVSVSARGFTSHFLNGIGERDIIDELRVIMVGNRQTTAYFTFSSQIGPPLHQFRIFGPKKSLFADFDHQTLVSMPMNYKSYLNQFIPPFLAGRQYVANGLRNVGRFLQRDFHAESGLYTLLRSFYTSITDGSPLPISYRDILLTSRTIDDILMQIK
jgi:predicted dehydrogenase